MKHRPKNLLSLFLIVLMLFSLVSCGSSTVSEIDYSDSYDGISSYKSDTSGIASSDYYIDDNDLYTGEETEDNGTSESSENQSSEQILVYTCQMTIETLTFDDSLSSIKSLVTQYNGITEQMTIEDDAYNWYYSDYVKTYPTMNATMVIRIPTESYDAFMEALTGEGKITEQSQQVENITTTYYDTATTIESLKIQEERLLEMMEEADTVEDMLSIEDRLSEVQNELNIYQNRLNTMDTDAAYSTFTISLEEVLEYSEEETPVKTSTFGDRLKNALSGSLENFLTFLENLLFFLIYALPILLVLGAIALIMVLIIRSIIKASEKKKKSENKSFTAVKDSTPVKNTSSAENTENELK